jgi:hypothetical protein
LNQNEAADGCAAYGVRDGTGGKLTQPSVDLEEFPWPNGAAGRVTESVAFLDGILSRFLVHEMQRGPSGKAPISTVAP